jgi:hypothetical protein
MRYGTSGTPDTGSNYSSNGVYNDSTTTSAAAARFNGSSHYLLNNAYTSGDGVMINISSPFLSKQTTYSSSAVGLTSQLVVEIHNGILNTTTSYTDLVLFSATNISGVISIYGMANS